MYLTLPAMTFAVRSQVCTCAAQCFACGCQDGVEWIGVLVFRVMAVEGLNNNLR